MWRMVACFIVASAVFFSGCTKDHSQAKAHVNKMFSEIGMIVYDIGFLSHSMFLMCEGDILRIIVVSRNDDGSLEVERVEKLSPALQCTDLIDPKK